jgi:pyruvate ferredoxin oxidoreductase delta subunit
MGVKKLTIGAVIKEIGSTVRHKTGGWRMMRPEIDQQKCVRCGICWMYCPDGAVKRDSQGRFVVDYNYCKGCGICANECPVKAIAMKLEEK